MRSKPIVYFTVLIAALSAVAALVPWETLAQTGEAAGGTLVPFVEDPDSGGKWGFKDEKGNVVIEPRFSFAYEFSPEGLAAVIDQEIWVYIDRTGGTVIRPFIFDNGPDYFSEGLARFTEDDKFGYFDKTGKVVIEPRFDFVFPFSRGVAEVCQGCEPVWEGEHYKMVGGRWGVIDKEGEFVIPLKLRE